MVSALKMVARASQMQVVNKIASTYATLKQERRWVCDIFSVSLTLTLSFSFSRIHMDGGDQITKPQSHQMIKIKIKGDCETSIPKRESSAVAPIEEQREVVLTKLLHAMPPSDPNLFAMLKSLWRKMDAAALL